MMSMMMMLSDAISVRRRMFGDGESRQHCQRRHVRTVTTVHTTIRMKAARSSVSWSVNSATTSPTLRCVSRVMTDAAAAAGLTNGWKGGGRREHQEGGEERSGVCDRRREE